MKFGAEAGEDPFAKVKALITGRSGAVSRETRVETWTGVLARRCWTQDHVNHLEGGRLQWASVLAT